MIMWNLDFDDPNIMLIDFLLIGMQTFRDVMEDLYHMQTVSLHSTAGWFVLHRVASSNMFFNAFFARGWMI